MSDSIILALLLLAVCVCAAALPAAEPPEAPAPSLKDAFKDAFLIGASLNHRHFSGEDARALPIITTHFNTITSENVLKWGEVHPAPGRFDFSRGDQFVAFGEAHKMFIVGHALIWHWESHTPKWLVEDAEGNPVDRDTLLAAMREHIHTVVGRYKGRIHAWDVVNEALNDDGTYRQSPWMTIIGEDYIRKAFEFAHEADPAAELYYNEYGLHIRDKRKGAIALVKKLQARGVPVAGIGSQDHVDLRGPTAAQLDVMLADLATLGVKVMITELDVNVLPPKENPYPDGLPDAVQQALARRYAEIFTVYVKHREVIDRVTFWNVTDADSWLNNWPVKGRTNHPLLFDRDGKPKPALDAVLRTAPGWEKTPR